MLSKADAAGIRRWVEAADRWAHAAQELVGAASHFATVSRDVAPVAAGQDGGADTVTDLERLAVELERDTSDLRDRYLATAESINGYRDVLD